MSVKTGVRWHLQQLHQTGFCVLRRCGSWFGPSRLFLTLMEPRCFYCTGSRNTFTSLVCCGTVPTARCGFCPLAHEQSLADISTHTHLHTSTALAAALEQQPFKVDSLFSRGKQKSQHFMSSVTECDTCDSGRKDTVGEVEKEENRPL